MITVHVSSSETFIRLKKMEPAQLNRPSSLLKLSAVKHAPNTILCSFAECKVKADGIFVKSFKTGFSRGATLSPTNAKAD